MDYKVEAIDEHTWMIEEYDEAVSCYMYLLEGSEKALLIDTGMGQIPLGEIVEGLTKLPVEVLNTHAHIDHIGGNSLFEKVYLHEKEREVYRLHSGGFHNYFPQYAYHAARDNIIWYTGEPEMDLGGRCLQILLTPGHSEGSVCILDKERKWLFSGDTCCKAAVLLALDFSETVAVYRQSLQKLLEYKDDYVLTWPGHHSVPVVPEIIEQFRDAADLLLLSLIHI